jgi:hypothetical protein
MPFRQHGIFFRTFDFLAQLKTTYEWNRGVLALYTNSMSHGRAQNLALGEETALAPGAIFT